MNRETVYIIGTTGSDNPHRCKIGFTRGNPKQRLRDLQCGSPIILMIYNTFDGPVALEQRLHSFFAPLGTHGEWFSVKGKLLEFLFKISSDDEHVSREKLIDQLHHVAFSHFSPDDDLFGTDGEYRASVEMSAWEPLADLLYTEEVCA